MIDRPIAARDRGGPVTALGPYPLIEPHATGVLDVGDGHAVYWEPSG